MNTKFRYGTVLEAMDYLRQHGYNKDFRQEGDYLIVEGEKFDADNLHIEVIYRYEGSTNPGEEATVYGITTTTGIKGILIVTDGIYSSDHTNRKLLQKLHQAKMDGYRGGAA